jgi:hypothetical protein
VHPPSLGRAFTVCRPMRYGVIPRPYAVLWPIRHMTTSLSFSYVSPWDTHQRRRKRGIGLPCSTRPSFIFCRVYCFGTRQIKKHRQPVCNHKVYFSIPWTMKIHTVKNLSCKGWKLRSKDDFRYQSRSCTVCGVSDTQQNLCCVLWPLCRVPTRQSQKIW